MKLILFSKTSQRTRLATLVLPIISYKDFDNDEGTSFHDRKFTISHCSYLDISISPKISEKSYYFLDFTLAQ